VGGFLGLLKACGEVPYQRGYKFSTAATWVDPPGHLHVHRARRAHYPSLYAWSETSIQPRQQISLAG